VKSESKTIDVRESVVSKIYDTQIGSFSTDGAWDPAAIDVIAIRSRTSAFSRPCRTRRRSTTTSSCR